MYVLRFIVYLFKLLLMIITLDRYLHINLVYPIKDLLLWNQLRILSTYHAMYYIHYCPVGKIRSTIDQFPKTQPLRKQLYHHLLRLLLALKQKNLENIGYHS